MMSCLSQIHKPMQIRIYNQHDKSSLIQLFRDNSPKFFAVEEEQDYRNYLENEVEDYFVLINNSEIVGCGGINYFPNQRMARISWDMVKASAHGTGIGTKLTEYRINLLEQNSEVEKIVVRTSQLAYKFYEKMGFQLIKVQEDFWANNLHLYEMEVILRR